LSGDLCIIIIIMPSNIGYTLTRKASRVASSGRSSSTSSSNNKKKKNIPGEATLNRLLDPAKYEV
jgi:hypothetical protein